MSAPAQTEPDDAPPSRRWRAGPITNILISLVVLVVPLVLLVAFCQPDERKVRAIDPRGAYKAAAREAPFPVVQPGRLPSGAKATNAAIDRGDAGTVTLRVTYLTDGGEYLQLLQSNVGAEGLIDDELGDVTIEGTEQIAAHTWQRYGGSREGESALVRLEQTYTVMVLGDVDDAAMRAFVRGLGPVDG